MYEQFLYLHGVVWLFEFLYSTLQYLLFQMLSAFDSHSLSHRRFPLFLYGKTRQDLADSVSVSQKADSVKYCQQQRWVHFPHPLFMNR